MEGYLVISKGAELVRVPLKSLVYIEAQANYSEIVTLNGKKTIVSFQLGQIEDLISRQLGENDGTLLRIGRGLIVNSAYIFKIDVTTQQLILSDGDKCWYQLTASQRVLAATKAYLEAEQEKEEQ